MTRELRHKRGQLIEQMRSMVDAAKADNLRDFSAEERTKYEALNNEQKLLKDQIEREENVGALETELRTAVTKPELISPGDLGKAGTESRGDSPDKEKETQAKEYRAKFAQYLAGRLDEREIRNLQKDINTSGGYLVAPEQMVNDLIRAVDDELVFRAFAKKYTIAKAVSLGVPRLSTKMSAASWTDELTLAAADTALAFGKRAIFPHPGSAFIKVSEDLLSQSVLDTEGIVRGELARVIGELEETAFMTGTGAKQPLGLFTASSDGIDTGRDMSTGNNTTAPTVDGLKRAKHKIKPQYRPRARWLAHDDFYLEVSLLKDGEGRYLLQPSSQAGEPDMLLGLPTVTSMFAPNTFTTGKYVAIVGDFNFYWIVDTMQFSIRRLDELYAATNEVGFKARFHVDGAPVLAEAFARVKLA